MLKRQKLQIVGCFMILISITHGQSVWSRTYGGSSSEMATSVIETSDQALLAVGFTHSFGSGPRDMYLVKTDMYGDTLWTKTIGGLEWDAAQAVLETSDQAYLVLGTTYLYGDNGPYNQHVLLVKTDQNGDTLWTKVYNRGQEDVATSLIETSDQSYLIVGYTRQNVNASADILILKTDLQGDTLWTKSYGGIENDIASSVIEGSDQSYIIAGNKYTSGFNDYDGFLLKFTASGDSLWTRMINWDNSFDIALSVIETSDHTLLIAGGNDSFTSSYSSIHLIKTDLDGYLLWRKTFSEFAGEFGRSVIETSDQSYLIAGESTGSNIDPSELVLLKTDFGGDTLWTKKYGGSSWDAALSVIETSDQSYVLGGYTLSFGNGASDMWLIKTDYSGETTQPSSVAPIGNASIPAQLLVFPNPVNGMCHIFYTLSEESNISIHIFDITGKKIWNHECMARQAGSYTTTWKAENMNGVEVVSGVYLVTISSPTWRLIRKLIVIN